jgi:hypothetical protein
MSKSVDLKIGTTCKVTKECGHVQLIILDDAELKSLRAGNLTLGDKINCLAPYKAGKCDKCKEAKMIDLATTKAGWDYALERGYKVQQREHHVSSIPATVTSPDGLGQAEIEVYEDRYTVEHDGRDYQGGNNPLESSSIVPAEEGLDRSTLFLYAVTTAIEMIEGTS